VGAYAPHPSVSVFVFIERTHSTRLKKKEKQKNMIKPLKPTQTQINTYINTLLQMEEKQIRQEHREQYQILLYILQEYKSK
jgi:hypothetical protein